MTQPLNLAPHLLGDVDCRGGPPERATNRLTLDSVQRSMVEKRQDVVRDRHDRARQPAWEHRVGREHDCLHRLPSERARLPDQNRPEPRRAQLELPELDVSSGQPRDERRARRDHDHDPADLRLANQRGKQVRQVVDPTTGARGQAIDEHRYRGRVAVTAENSFTGSLTSPKLLAPLQIASHSFSCTYPCHGVQALSEASSDRGSPLRTNHPGLTL